MPFFRNRIYEDLRFSLEQLLRLLAGALEMGGATQLKYVIENDPSMSSMNGETRPRGMEYYFEMLPPFADFTGFVEIPHEEDTSVHLFGINGYFGFHAHIVRPKGPVFVSASTSFDSKPIKAAKKLKKAFMRAGALDTDFR